VLGDRVQFQPVIINLLVNGIQTVAVGCGVNRSLPSARAGWRPRPLAHALASTVSVDIGPV
jgi:hypothetical protein